MRHRRSTELGRIIWLPLLITLMVGCATVPLPTRSERVGTDDSGGRCAEFFDALDQRVAAAGVIDPGAFRVKGYPYLRVDRFLASFKHDVTDGAAFDAWVEHMQAMDQGARRHEIANLPDNGTTGDRPALLEQVRSCGDRLKALDFMDDARRREFIGRVAAPDDYILLRQILGLYPIPRWFISRGVDSWQAGVRRDYSVAAPVDWSSHIYMPPGGDVAIDPPHRITEARHDALGIPQYGSEALQILFQRHAPIWQVRAGGEADRIGTPVWNAEGALAVDTGRPVTYTHLSHTRFRGEVLTQLNYMIWFPARPKSRVLDIYSGHLDGMIYRVTLDAGGEPLLYETIHHCGCYYTAFATRRLSVRGEIVYKEPPLILAAPKPPETNGQRLTVGLLSGTHFVRHFYVSNVPPSGQAQTYILASYEELRSLGNGRGGRRSMFAPDSLAPGTQRLERWLFWPTGVYSAGAMRQWGRHAVAFAGRRHFDDPFYIEKMFETE